MRAKEIRVANYRETLSGTRIPKVARPRFRSAAERLRWRLLENVPGEFPFASGVFPFKREAEDPTRMFAGEGTSGRTNKRFHYLADGQPAKRLSTAFDALTLYGEDPGRRPDIYGKIGESGVAVFTVEEAERSLRRLRSLRPDDVGVDDHQRPGADDSGVLLQRRDPPAVPALPAPGRPSRHHRGRGAPARRFARRHVGVRSALCSKTTTSTPEVQEEALKRVRGTVQADILKEDQGQNTCIFSTEFALRCMGDVQQYFTDHGVRNFYSVSISGYHIAEAGANPIHQLAFTLANGLTYVEYYRAAAWTSTSSRPTCRSSSPTAWTPSIR